MNATKVILLLLAVFGIAINPLSEVNGQTETQAKQIIQSFMDSKGMDIEPGTEEYKTFMRGIVWSEYPELTGNDSDFVKNQEELDYVLDYAWKYSGYKDLYGDYNEPDTEEATSPDQFGEQRLAAINLLTSSGRSNAIAYAYQWSTSGGTSRNPAYPDFGVDDCTNFVSQAMKAGGFIEKGSGDGCKHENTSTEWYVESNPSPPWWCTGDFRNWEWSTSWSVPWPFRDYFAYQNDYAIPHGWTTSVSTAKYFLSPGDVIQLQYEDNGEWISFHTMIVTDEDEDDLYVTYHSNAGGFDEVDKPLSTIDLGSNKRFQLVEIKFPALIFLPLILNSGGTTGDPLNSPNPYPAPMEYKEPQPLGPYPAP
ncbi:MAG TPA: amidase domain-containing protein [Candidatus Woesebacteria bacterium]|jgi:hypothetical protein|nr:amidase domain-containing protein [Candidatus Woesebacteria bacterium]